MENIGYSKALGQIQSSIGSSQNKDTKPQDDSIVFKKILNYQEAIAKMNK